MRTVRMVDSARAGTTVLALLMGLTVLGISGNTLRVYNDTHVAHEFLLPLWPDNFNVRPTVSLVIGSAIVLVANLVAVCFSHVGSVSLPPPYSDTITPYRETLKLTKPPFSSAPKQPRTQP